MSDNVACDREVGVTTAGISWEFERWASIAAMTFHCAAVVSTYSRKKAIHLTHYSGNERRVHDPIDDSSSSEHASHNTTQNKDHHNMADKKHDAIATIPAGLEGMITTERPAGADEGLLGNEGIGRDDILMPRLGLAQKMSPEIDPTNKEKYIEGLQFTDMFHSLTRQNYGKGPLKFVILRRDNPRWIEFNPLEQGGGIRDRNVPPGDPRTQFQGNEKPIATMFYDFIVLLLNDLKLDSPIENVVALSLKSSALYAARHLGFLINERGKKMIYKGVYEVTTGSKTDKKSGGVYATYNFKNANWLTAGSPLEHLAAEMFDTWKERDDVNIDRGGEIDDSMAANQETPAEM